MDAWLKAHLLARGVLDSDGVSRRVSSSRCPECRAAVLRGLDSDRCGWPVVASIDSVDQLGELLAIANGLRTFDLIPRQVKSSTGWQLDGRRSAHIAKPRRHQVHAEHRCGLVLPAAPQSPRWLPRPIDPPF